MSLLTGPLRSGGARTAARLLRRSQADHWSFLFSQIAVYTFALALVTGVFLAVFFKPSMTGVTYHGSYHALGGVRMSQAYASTLHISFDVRGGLLMRQIHHWAALIFVAAVCLQLLRLFFTGAFRRPRALNWLIWVTLLVLGIAAGWTGGILPDDTMSGGSLGVLQGVLESIPVVGTHLMLWVFGGDVPGQHIIPRLFWVHALLPVAMAGLFVLRHWLVRRHGHTRFAAPAGSGRLGSLQHAPAAAAVAMFFATCAVLALLGTLAQINPVWLYGPYQPGATTAGAVPDWYMGFLDGALRIMPGWQIEVAGHPLVLAVLVPALIVPGAFFTILAAYPLLERWLTGDRGLHHVLDRPRDAATRTAVGAAGITFYGLLWAAAANDQIAYHFQLDLYAVTWFFRIAVIVGPPLAYVLTQRICLGLTARERDEAEHGRPTGRIVMSPGGGFSEITGPARPAAGD
ncbi:MAG TPA: cytochrome b N-terminal domain-containing protein, partial [Streptosporangiaceae bacterium]